MTTSPEIKVENPSQAPQAIEQIPEQFQVTPGETQQGIQSVSVTPTQIPQVSNVPSQQITPVPAPQGQSVTLPSDPVALTQQSKGDPSDAVTWNAWFWLRMMKKALAKHISILVKGGATTDGPKS